MLQLLQSLSTISTLVIGAFAVLHLGMFAVLRIWSRRDWRSMVAVLDDFTRTLRHRSILDRHVHYSEQIEAFIADVREVVDDTTRVSDRQALLERVQLLDEKRRYLGSLSFDTTYNMSRTMIEAYPLAGVLGTILAIGAALASPQDGGASSSINLIVERFGDAIWSTFAGLIAAIVLMFVNSLLEPGFQRLEENRAHLREMIARVKRELSMGMTAATSPPPPAVPPQHISQH